MSFFTDSDIADIYTSDYGFMRKFDRLVEKNPNEWKFIRDEKCQGDIVGKFYQCPQNLISFRSRTKVGRELSEEEKQTMTERLQQARAKSQT